MNIKCAGVVLYNPDLERLHENLRSIRDQVDLIIFVDNSSLNIKNIEDMIKNEAKVELIKNDSNLGIAAALNQIAQFALNTGYDWVYLLDQDSISSPTIMANYEKYTFDNKVALLTPYIIDINKSSIEDYQSQDMPDYSMANWAITSGSLIRLTVWEQIGRFSEYLFIDSVDIDYSIRLNINGYKQLRINNEYLLQEVGNAEKTSFYRLHKDNIGQWRWIRHYRSNHSSIRYYYMIRNNIILVKKYLKYRNIFKSISFIGIFAISKILFEKNKWEIANMVFKGFADGIKFQVPLYVREGFIDDINSYDNL